MTYEFSENLYPAKTTYTYLSSTNPYVITILGYVWNGACRDCACRDAFICFSANAHYPYHAYRYYQPITRCSFWVVHLSPIPLPETTLDDSKAMLYPCIPYRQALDASGGKSVSMNHASFSYSSQCAIKVHSIQLLLNANPRPCQLVPGALAKLLIG